MRTVCSANKLQFQALGRRRLEADFSGGQVSSDGGGLLLREADLRLRLTEQIADCFVDWRREELVEHSVRELVAQRVYALALGYEDLNDHESLSRDPLLASCVGKTDPEGRLRECRKHRGQGLASASTLGRVERTKAEADRSSRYDKVVCDFDALRRTFVQLFIESFDAPPKRLVLDVDPTDIALHGQQEQRFYHGYYGHYCYLPMYLFCGDFPLAVKLRPSNIDGSLGVVELLEPVVEQLRAAFPRVQLVVRADSGFCREQLMAWCEQHGVEYVLGMAQNDRLTAAIGKQMQQARREHLQTGKPARRFRSFGYRTRNSWSRSRRVVGKAEHLDKGANPRFVVTSFSATQCEKRCLYEKLYCARGEMENRIKEQLELFADRASCHTFRGNEIRLWWAMAAHLLVTMIRRLALKGTALENAQAPTLRAKLLKIGALVRISVRRVYVRLSSAFPLQQLFALALQRLQCPLPAS
jgi:hypothetical protein